MQILTLQKPNKIIKGEIELAGSKSINNRALMIRALCSKSFPIHRMANAQDVELMQAILSSDDPIKDAGPAGTTFRFMTAYLALQPGEQTLTGTQRMKQRPIGLLVDALRSLGAQIEYIEKEGFPPLLIKEPGPDLGKNNEISIPADTSSQYISALLMIAPTLPNGLSLTLVGDIVSRPYLEMTLSLMAYFGIRHEWVTNNQINIAHQAYQPRAYTVEADWSAASYHYALAAFADELDLQLNGLFENSVQGDSVLVAMMEHFGVQSIFNDRGVRLLKSSQVNTSALVQDFIKCPDLAQTIAVVCAGLGIQGTFSGLKTLRIKETDRIAALQKELEKINVAFQSTNHSEPYKVMGKASFEDTPVFATYEDHRMAMAFAPLAMYQAIQIEEPDVVGKSYPDFWKDMEYLGFELKY